MELDKDLDSTVRLGKYATIRACEVEAKIITKADTKFATEPFLVLTLEVEPKWKLDKPKLVKVYIAGSDFNRLKEMFKSHE